MCRSIIAVSALPALVLAASCLRAAVTPNPLFSDNAVLQQGISVPVWGSAKDGERVTVKLGTQKASTVARDGKWMVRLKPLKAGGPFTMTISGENTVELKNILVGEVWVASGQSNMQWPVKHSLNPEQTIAGSKDPMIRLFSVPRKTALTPQSSVEASWVECGPETVPDFSAVAYFFGRDLRKNLGVPVGLINTSWGGTRVQAWTASRFLDYPLEHRKATLSNVDWMNSPNRMSVLYNGMIAPLIPYAIRGAIWYQGESNAGEAYAYRSLFPNMIRNWREDWGQGDFPFLFVQLAPWQPKPDEPPAGTWAELREAQLHTMRTVPNTGMAVITDCGDAQDIHPKAKEPVGARLALLARNIAYGQKIVGQGPVYKGMKVKGDRIVLSFDGVGSGLEAKGGPLRGFTIAGEDRNFVDAQAEIVGRTVVVRSPQVPKPVAVRFGWSNCPDVNFFNKEGLPASPFRTDDWPGVTWPK
jgi:sialate O-acetylesterase